MRIALALAVVLCAPASALAQADDPAATEPPRGWRLRLKLAATLSFTHNRRVVGNPDGLTMQIGGALEGEASRRFGQHEWQNQLLMSHGQSKTPLIDPFVKTTDTFEATTTYLYHLRRIDWFGPFFRVRLTTALLPGYHVQAEDVNVVATLVDGSTVTTPLPAQSRLALTGAFEPLVLRESTGAFALLDRGERLKVDVKLGPAVQEIFTRGGFVVADDAATPVLEVQELRDSVEAGAELGGEATGKFREAFGWTLRANFFYPFVTSVETDLEGLERLNAAIEAKLSAKLTGWASLDYTLTATRVPLVVAAWQIQNGLLLTVAFERVHPPPPPPPCPPGCVP